MNLATEVNHILKNRKFLDYFRQRNITPTNIWKQSNRFEMLAEFAAHQIADLGEYIYYFMKEDDMLVIWSDNANVLNFSFSNNGNVTLVSQVMAPPFFMLLQYQSLQILFAKGFTDPTENKIDTLYISDGKLVYTNHNNEQRKVDIFYYYMDRRGM